MVPDTEFIRHGMFRIISFVQIKPPARRGATRPQPTSGASTNPLPIF